MMHAGLRKIITINSYQEKKLFSEYDVDVPVQLTGDNGSGKTSLLRLIPFFYGATGSKIVRSSNVNKPFVDWYLAHNNSYIVFEFATARGQVVHVICYRSLATKSGIVYQFVKGVFEQSVLIKEDLEGKPFAIQSNKLASELTSAGFDYESRITSVKEYREIIQNINSSSRCNKYLGYSLCSGRNDVRHIEKITAALIQGEFNMADTKALFLDILEQGNNTLEFGVDAIKIEQWCDDYKGLTAFLGKKEAFETAISNNKQIVFLTNRLASALLIIREESEVLEGKLSKTKKDKADYSTKSDEAIENVSSKKLDKNLQANSTNDAIRKLDSEIEANDDKYLDYENRGFPEYSVKLKQLPDMEEKLETEKRNYADLEKKVENAKDKHDRDLQNLTSQHIDEKSKLVEQKLEAEQEASRKKGGVEGSYSKQLNELTTSYSEFVKEKNTALNSRTSELATQQQRLNNPDINQLLIEQKEQLDVAKGELQDRQNALIIAITNAEKEHSDLCRQRTDLLESLEKARNDKRDAEIKLELVNARLDPESGTLFSFLEEHKEGWQSSPLGRVLTERLLMDTTLAPSLGADSGTLFDLSIDTSNLTDCVVTNQADIEDQVKLIDLIDKLEDTESYIDKRLKRNDSAIKDANLALTELRNDFRNAENDLKQTKSNLQNKKLEIAHAKEVLIEQITAEIKIVTRNISLIKKELSNAEERFEDAKSKLSEDKLLQISSIDTTLELKTSTINETMTRNAQYFGESKERIQMEYEQRLADQGINKEVYGRYNDNILKLEAQLKELKSLKSQIESYELWLSIYEKDDPKRRSERQKKAKELESVYREIQGLETKLKELRSEATRVKKAFDDTVTKLEKRKERAHSAITRLSNYEVFDNHEEIDEHFNYTGDLNSLLSEVESKLPELDKLTKQRKRDILLMEKITFGLGDGELYRFWTETSRNTISDDIIASDSKRIYILEKIMNDIIPQVSRITIESAVNMGRMLVDFKDRLLSFDREIKKLGRSVSEQVQENNTFAVVGSIDINVESSLSKLQGWQDIINFSEIYEEWDRTGAAELPSKEFFSALNTLTYHISADKVKKPTELFDIKFEVIENNQRKVAKTDKDMRDLASNGTNLLIQSMLYLALLTKQRGASLLSITYPTDEIGKLTAENQAKLLAMMDAHRFKVVAAQPDGNNQTANLFTNLYHLTPDKNIFNKPKTSKLALAKAAEANQEVGEEA